MFSVVIPLYNKEKFIAEAVASVLEQSFTNLELIVVNDGSDDESLRQIESITDDRLRIISIVNSGVSVARNTGIRAAKYKWIGFLDADDWWATEFLSEIKIAIDTYTGNKLFASGRSLIFSEGIKRYSHEYLPDEGETGICNYFKVISNYLPLINCSNSVIKRNLFEEKGYFREGQKKHEDHDLWLRLSINDSVVFVNKPLSFYRKTEDDSVSKVHYSATDFCIYLNTLVEVKAKLSEEEKKNFIRYIRNFVFLTYLKYSWHYSCKDRKKVYKLVCMLLPKPRLYLLNLVNTMPFNVYPILKYFTR